MFRIVDVLGGTSRLCPKQPAPFHSPWEESAGLTPATQRTDHSAIPSSHSQSRLACHHFITCGAEWSILMAHCWPATRVRVIACGARVTRVRARRSAVVHTGQERDAGEQPGEGPPDRQDPAHPQDRPSPQGSQSGGVSAGQSCLGHCRSDATPVSTV